MMREHPHEFETTEPHSLLPDGAPVPEREYISPPLCDASGKRLNVDAPLPRDALTTTVGKHWTEIDQEALDAELSELEYPPPKSLALLARLHPQATPSPGTYIHTYIPPCSQPRSPRFPR